MASYYFKNEATGNKYKVVKLDKEAGTVTLRGKFGEFVEKFDKERFKKMGYLMEKEEEE